MRHPSNDVAAAIERARHLHHAIAEGMSGEDYDDWAGQLILDLASGMTGFKEVIDDLDLDGDQVARAIAAGVAQDVRLDELLGAGDETVEVDAALTAEIEAMESARGLPPGNGGLPASLTVGGKL